MPEETAKPVKRSRAWLWGGIVVILAIAGAGGAYWWLQNAPKTVAVAKRPNLIGGLGENLTALDTVAPSPDKLCSQTLARALDFGVLPPGASLANDSAKANDPDNGHYTCQAQGGGGTFTLLIDTSCPGSQDKTCFALDGVKGSDGTWLYKRRI